MKTNKNFLPGVLLYSILIFLFTLSIESNFFFKTFTHSNQQALVIRSTKIENIYNISPSKDFPGTFKFNYVYAKTSTNNNQEMNFDFPILPFDEEKARAILEKEYGFVDFGPIRDAWGYPIRENIFMRKKEQKIEDQKRSSLKLFKPQTAQAYDIDPLDQAVYNCRANPSVTGYFKAYFEDVALQNGIGFAHPIHGQSRREIACQVLQNTSELLMMDTVSGNLTPDILFMRSDIPMPPGALAGASSYFGYYTTGPDNGSLHKHIISRQDPTPAPGSFDAFVITNFNNINWSSDTPLAPGVYDLYTVMEHEILHTLGFRSGIGPVVTQTGVPHTHGTFDYHTHKNESLQNRFITALTGFLNVPIGAPSPWFITNEVVYRGIKNIAGTTPDGIRPVYSPPWWQQGSSLSHFDMNRANGEVYVMHPSIGANTEREIHEHEKEVLCHLGYMVLGMAGCEVPSPVAVDDFIISEISPICINVLQNDLNHSGLISQLKIDNMQSISVQPGDVIEYYQIQGCSGSTQLNPSGARSIRIIPTTDMSPRFFQYTNKNIITNRVSVPAKISLIPSCESIVDDDEYVCNGDFELTTVSDNVLYIYNQAFVCPNSQWNYFHSVLFWCHYRFTPDLLSTNHPSVPSNILNVNGDKVAHLWQGVPLLHRESIQSKLKTPLTAGQEYVLSFDAAYTNNSGGSISFWLNSGHILADQNQFPQHMISNNILPTSNEWYHVEQSFIPNSSYDFLIIKSEDFVNEFNFIIDNVSIRPIRISLTNTITGHLYQDLDQNGSWEQLAEPGLSGISVNIFEAGNTTPLQTVATQDLPNTGKYTFSNLEDGTYHIALQAENLYSSITQPTSNNILPGYSHARSVTVSNGQMVENQNFGVNLSEVVLSEADINVRKFLTDSTLSLFDRQITWRIIVGNGGPDEATNIELLDVFPSGLLYVSHTTSDPSMSFNTATGAINIPVLQSGNSMYMDIIMYVPYNVCGKKINTVSVTSLDQTDPFLANNQSSSTLGITSCIPTISLPWPFGG